MSTEQENFEYELREILDWHLSGNLNIKDDDCGCTDEERHAWEDRSRIIGEQAYIDHIYEALKELMVSKWR